jgi:hypothetical protein
VIPARSLAKQEGHNQGARLTQPAGKKSQSLADRLDLPVATVCVIIWVIIWLLKFERGRH